MRRWLSGLILSLSTALCACATAPAPQAPADARPRLVAAAIDDPARPQGDRDRDGARRPAEMLALAEVREGARIADLIPGGGYFTRLFSAAVGPRGHVYAVVPPPAQADAPAPAVAAIAADPHYANVSVVVSSFTDFAPPEPLDLVWTAQNYHDLHLARFGLDVAAVNRAIFAALKPGGLYVVVDHAAEPGSGLRDVDTLHRIDEAAVRAEVEAAGFVFEGSSEALRNPADTRRANVFEPAIRGRTDQFVLRFRKPG